MINFILAAYGLTFILIHGKIFESLRPNKDPNKMWTLLFYCPLCMGFWVGAFLFCVNSQTELFTFDVSLVNGLLLGSLSSGTSYALCMLISDGGFQYEYRTKRDVDTKMDAKTSNKLLQG